MSQAMPVRTNRPASVRLLSAPRRLPLPNILPYHATPPAPRGVRLPAPSQAGAPPARMGALPAGPGTLPGAVPAAGAPAVAARPAGTLARPTRPARMWSWMRLHKIATTFVVAMVVASAGVLATVLIKQDITTTPSAVAPEVTFLSGTDYTSITNTGFAVLTLGSSGASAALTTLKGIPGAATVDLTNLLRIQGAPTGTKDYTGSTLSTDVALNAAITHLYVTIKHGATTDLNQWDAKSGVASSTFTITHGVTYDVSISVVIADGTAAGALSPAFNIQLNLVP